LLRHVTRVPLDLLPYQCSKVSGGRRNKATEAIRLPMNIVNFSRLSWDDD